MVNDRRWKKAMIDNATGDAMEPLQGSFHFCLAIPPPGLYPGVINMQSLRDYPVLPMRTINLNRQRERP